MRVNIGMPVVRTDGRSVARSVGHVITKFSGMGRFIYPWCSAGALRARSSAKNTPRSFATGVDDIGLPQSVIVKSGNCRSNCGTPMTRSLVLSGSISSEL